MSERDAWAHHSERKLVVLLCAGIYPWPPKLQHMNCWSGPGLWGINTSAGHPSQKRMAAFSLPCLLLRMKFEDFKVHFDKVEICNLTPDALEDSTAHKWEVTIHQGSWVRGATAGGCRNFLGKYISVWKWEEGTLPTLSSVSSERNSVTHLWVQGGSADKSQPKGQMRKLKPRVLRVLYFKDRTFLWLAFWNEQTSNEQSDKCSHGPTWDFVVKEFPFLLSGSLDLIYLLMTFAWAGLGLNKPVKLQQQV